MEISANRYRLADLSDTELLLGTNRSTMPGPSSSNDEYAARSTTLGCACPVSRQGAEPRLLRRTCRGRGELTVETTEEHQTRGMHLREAKTVVLTTFRRDGSGVATPVSIAFDGDRAFFRTWHTAGKVKRLARCPNVEVAPSTLRGERIGPVVSAEARRLEGQEAARAAKALGRRHPFLQRLLVPVTHWLMRYRTMHYELLCDELGSAATSADRRSA